MSECPNIAWAVDGWTPLAASVVAKVCRRLWKVNPVRIRVPPLTNYLQKWLIVEGRSWTRAPNARAASLGEAPPL
jgi:hypothetical protein